MILIYQPARSVDRLYEGGIEHVAGDLINVSEERARQLLDELGGDVSEQRSGLTRAQLNEQAEEIGVENPAKLASKQAVLDAIAEAQQERAAAEAETAPV